MGIGVTRLWEANKDPKKKHLYSVIWLLLWWLVQSGRLETGLVFFIQSTLAFWGLGRDVFFKQLRCWQSRYLQQLTHFFLSPVQGNVHWLHMPHYLYTTTSRPVVSATINYFTIWKTGQGIYEFVATVTYSELTAHVPWANWQDVHPSAGPGPFWSFLFQPGLH